MPVKRFRLLQQHEFDRLTNGGSLILGTTSDPIARNLYKNSQTRIRERGEHCAFMCYGAVEMTIAGGIGQQGRTALFPVCLKRASLQTSGDNVKAAVSEDEEWKLNPVLKAHLNAVGIKIAPGSESQPKEAIDWIKAQLGNRASRVTSDSYVGLFSSQQMVVQERLNDPLLRRALARNPVIQAKLAGTKVSAVELGERTDEGIEELGLVLPCDDSQLRVVQLSEAGCSLQVEGPPGTGKSQTIANIISSALYKGRSVLLVCDKKAAIVQVEERLSNCGLKPALLNLHDEDLDKRDFLKQATEKFPIEPAPVVYPFDQLREARKALNDRVRFGRAITHPSLQVSKHQALGGLIQLRKELKQIPAFPIADWQSLSKDRLFKLLTSLAEWPDLAGVLADSTSVWNGARVEAFDDPNASNELHGIAQIILTTLERLEEVREWTATVGIERAISSDHDIEAVRALVDAVLKKPECHPRVVANPDVSATELAQLKSEWEKRQSLLDAHHPVPLTEQYSEEAEHEAKALLAGEGAKSWSDLSNRSTYHSDCQSKIKESQNRYLLLCDQVGLVYSPLLKVRRAQLQSVLRLGEFGGLISREWWQTGTNPVMSIDGWAGKLRACADHAKTAPVRLHFVALERVANTHWQHVEAMAEHGFNYVSYCLKFVNDRKCKYALRQAYPTIPARGFKQWREITLHAVAAHATAKSVRSAAESHVILKQLTENYLSVAHESADGVDRFLEHEDVTRLRQAAVLVEQWRTRNDLFEVASVHWQTFWESPNPNLLTQVESLLLDLGTLPLPSARADNMEEVLEFHEHGSQRIQRFLQTYERKDGCRTQSVLEGFVAQKEFAVCMEHLAPLGKYLAIQSDPLSTPDWEWLHGIIAWRDLFERLRGNQKLDIGSATWAKLRDRLSDHQDAMEKAYGGVYRFFGSCLSSVDDYDALKVLVDCILQNLSRYPLWLEKNRWQKKIHAFPEIKALWIRILEGGAQPEHAQRLFCFNLLRLCDPIAKPQGPELKQILDSFAKQDEHLASWLLDHLKAELRCRMADAADHALLSESELRRVSDLKRIPRTVRELVNSHRDYLLDAKPCWMMSPTSLANLIDSGVFEQRGTPFDLVIFDEASQIRVLDGLLSLAFGQQVIIVGDKHQLPPTDFFAGFANPDEDANAEDFGVSDSLLDEFAGVFIDDLTHAMLMSHYRSETPDLIRFSNDWFYDSKLEMYPPAHVSGIGRRLHYVPDAIYSEIAGQRSNPAEASEVIKLIELHVRDYHGKSLGIVTMNIPQMDLIDEQLRLVTSDAVRTFCNDEAKFFLRNLETVQGDEMDRIILSLTYGKNAAGKFNASVLGPLTKSGGERRLNVAITRSRSGMTIVSSLKAADLEASTAQSRGFQCLKALLTELENSDGRNFGLGSSRFEKRKDGVSNIVYCDSPFEEQVVEFLENQGYEIECQYGAGKYRIDMVVKERGRNLLAIECDGAAYHSSLVARTRDRARQRILEQQFGWRVHRIWSTNWWFFEQMEKDALIVAINSARAASPTTKHA